MKNSKTKEISIRKAKLESDIKNLLSGFLNDVGECQVAIDTSGPNYAYSDNGQVRIVSMGVSVRVTI